MNQPLIQALVAVVGDRLSTTESERDRHGRGEGRRDVHRPDVVVFPVSTSEVAELMRVCAAHRTPVVPFGAGSSLEGQVNALRGGVSMDLSGMDRILRTSVDDLDVTLQAGVTRQALVRELEGTGTTFFVDPGANATIGGMLATGASGTTSVRYGTMRDNVLGLTVVLADGQVMHTGGRARKSSAGYDLTRLLVGSEGTLGIITEATLRLHPVPDAIAALVVRFDSVEAAVATVVSILQCAIPMARMELLDALTVQTVNAYMGTSLPEAPLLFLEIHAFSEAARDEQLAAVQDLVAEHHGSVHATARTESDRHALWEARHKTFYAGVAARPGTDVITTDVCVPISQLPTCIAATRADLAQHGVQAPLVGHVGDGNFHLLLSVDPANPRERETVQALVVRLTDRALALGGTCSGEHGIGMGKQYALEREHGDALHMMRAIKHAFDPHNLLNPGKVLPPAPSVE